MTQMKLLLAAGALVLAKSVSSFTVQTSVVSRQTLRWQPLYAGTDVDTSSAPQPAPTPRPSEGMDIDHQEPEDAIIHIAPKAMKRLRELQQQSNEEIVLRMGVRNGGCSGLSYVMDFSKRDDIEDDDAVDEYTEEQIVCVVDAKTSKVVRHYFIQDNFNLYFEFLPEGTYYLRN